MKSDSVAVAVKAAAVSAGEAAVCGHLALMGLDVMMPPSQAPARYGRNVTIRNANCTGVTAVVYVEAATAVPPTEAWWLSNAVAKLERVCGVSLGLCGYHTQDWLLLKVE